MKRAVAILFTSWFFLLTADTAVAKTFDLDLDQEIYQEVKNNCHAPINGVRFKAFLVTLGESFQTLNPYQSKERWESWIKNKGIGQYTTDLLASPGLDAALEECFPNNPDRQAIFVADVLFSEAFAKFIPLAGPMLLGSKALALVSAYWPAAGVYVKWTAVAYTAIETIRISRTAYKTIQPMEEQSKAMAKSLEDILNAQVQKNERDVEALNNEILLTLQSERERIRAVLRNNPSDREAYELIKELRAQEKAMKARTLKDDMSLFLTALRRLNS